MHLVLFDIDGTLLLTGHMGQTSASEALLKVFGTFGRMDDFYPGGRTIEGIFLDTLNDAGFSEDDYLKKRDDLYDDFFSKFQKRFDSGEHHVYPLPGALDLLEEMRVRNDFLLGLVTGNHKFTAQLKLQAAGIDPGWFKVGAFGNESHDRSDLLPLAQERAEKMTGLKFPGKLTIVVGDTTRDVNSAKSVGARSIAVATGTDGWELLESAEPDCIFPDLVDLQAVLDGISGERNICETNSGGKDEKP